MTLFQKGDKVTIILMFCLIISLILASIFIFIPYSISSHKNSLFSSPYPSITHCGYTEKNMIKFFDNTIISNRMLSYAYIGVKINANDYLYLNNRQSLSSDSILSKNQSKYYPIILKNFHKIKMQYNLDDDQYVELIVNFVQSLPYYTDYSLIKYPLTTFTDGCGDCDDKSLLLTAILSQDNYNVSLVIIPPGDSEKYGHAMAGIASNSVTFSKSGYAMIETTKKDSIIGEFPITLNRSNVKIYKIGQGTKTYETYPETWIEANKTMFRVIKKNGTITSISQIHQDDS